MGTPPSKNVGTLRGKQAAPVGSPQISWAIIVSA
jgi:hypothetical protein